MKKTRFLLIILDFLWFFQQFIRRQVILGGYRIILNVMHFFILFNSILFSARARTHHVYIFTASLWHARRSLINPFK